MADYAALIRKKVANAHRITLSLQPVVTVTKAGTVDGSGDVVPGATFTAPALVDWRAQRRRTATGVDVVSRAVITFVEPQDVDEEDTIVLPDGTTGPILDLGGFVDKGTGKPFVLEVYLG